VLACWARRTGGRRGWGARGRGRAPVVVVGADLVARDLLLALGGHVGLVHVVLQAADDARVPVLHAAAEAPDLGCARALHGVLEVDVLRHAHLRVEQRRAALVAQVLARVLQAADHARAALRAAGAGGSAAAGAAPAPGRCGAGRGARRAHRAAAAFPQQLPSPALPLTRSGLQARSPDDLLTVGDPGLAADPRAGPLRSQRAGARRLHAVAQAAAVLEARVGQRLVHAHVLAGARGQPVHLLLALRPR